MSTSISTSCLLAFDELRALDRIDLLRISVGSVLPAEGDVGVANRENARVADEFHLFHLARYWSRIVGFAEVVGDGCDSLVEGDSGSLVRMATDQAGRVLREADLIPNLWTEYVDQLETMLTLRPVSVKVIERASDEFDKCLEAIGYDPWLDSETSNTKANKSRHSNPYQPPCLHDLP